MVLWERRAKECVDKIEPIDSLYFDVSVARHMLEKGKLDEALTWLDETHAILELRRSLEKGFITPEEYSSFQIIIGDIREAIKMTGALIQAMKTITELQTLLGIKAYLSFWRCMRQGILR